MVRRLIRKVFNMCTGNRDQMERALTRSSSRAPFGASPDSNRETVTPAPQLPLPGNPLKRPTPEENPLKYPTPEANPLKEPTLPLPKNVELPENTQLQTSKLNMKDFQNAFVNKVRPGAQKVAEALNVPVSAVIAQLAYESGWGKSALAAAHNNFGGLKAGSSWKGDIVSLPTKEKNQTETETAKFRAYKSPEDYAVDMITFLQKPRYKEVLGSKDPYQYALQLGLAGYHQDTPSVYADEIRRIAKQIEESQI